GTMYIMVAGGGYAHLAREKDVYKVSQWLNSMVVAAFVLKYRLGMRYHHPAELMDGKRAMQIVHENAQQWHLDKNRIGIMGFSAGGHLASTVGTHFDLSNPQATDSLQVYRLR